MTTTLAQRRPPAALTPRRETGPHPRATRAPLIGLVGITLLGIVLRSRGITSLGLWRDDAWAALSSRVGLGTAWHMWVTAPGFYAAERSWVSLGPGWTWWDQLLPLAIGIGAIPAMYGLARKFGFGAMTALGLAFVVSVDPICATYSTRLKEYGADFLMTCLVLAAGEAVRRRPDRRSLLLLAAATVGGFAVSASTVPVIVGTWLALLVGARAGHRASRQIAGAAVPAALGCAVVAAAFYRHVSPALHRFWSADFISHASPTAFTHSLWTVVADVAANMWQMSIASPAARTVVFLGMTAVVVLGMRRQGPMLAPTLAAVSALAACVVGVIPVGTGRTDEVLYPVLLLLLASALRRVRSWASNRMSGWAWRRPLMWVSVGLAMVALVSLGARGDQAYPGVDTAALAAAVTPQIRPGDTVVVDELMRYPWALDEDRTLHIRFGSDWATGFTVVSTQPGVFIAPSEYYEGGSDPAAWARSVSGAQRLWFVESPPLSVSPLYAALRKDGWRTVHTVRATGCAALLLERT